MAFFGSAYAVPLANMNMLPPKIMGAAVIDQKGSRVGVVRRVDTSADGKINRLAVAVFGGEKIVALDLKGLDYDEPDNVVKVTWLDKSQIEQLGPITN
jgi:hypothetical protein